MSGEENFNEVSGAPETTPDAAHFTDNNATNLNVNDEIKVTSSSVAPTSRGSKATVRGSIIPQIEPPSRGSVVQPPIGGPTDGSVRASIVDPQIEALNVASVRGSVVQPQIEASSRASVRGSVVQPQNEAPSMGSVRGSLVQSQIEAPSMGSVRGSVVQPQNEAPSMGSVRGSVVQPQNEAPSMGSVRGSVVQSQIEAPSVGSVRGSVVQSQIEAPSMGSVRGSVVQSQIEAPSMGSVRGSVVQSQIEIPLEDLVSGTLVTPSAEVASQSFDSMVTQTSIRGHSIALPTEQSQLEMRDENTVRKSFVQPSVGVAESYNSMIAQTSIIPLGGENLDPKWTSAGSLLLAPVATVSTLQKSRPSSLASIRSSRRTSSAGSFRFSQRASRASRESRKLLAEEMQRNLLDNMKNSELLAAVEELKKSTKTLELENTVFLHFLKKNEPSLIESMESTLKTVQTANERSSISSRRFTLTRYSRRESMFLGPSVSFITAGPQEKEGPKINVTQKTDLITREMDYIQDNLKKLTNKCNRIKHKLKAELEEMATREIELQETLTEFEDVFINGTSEKFTQKNPADKFARFMEEAFKRTRLTMDKIRLRTSSLKVQYQKLCNTLAQKKLLGENLQEVDFEQLQIENRRLVEKIEQRNLLLIELKRMNGHANLLLSRHKKLLLKKVAELKDIQESIRFKEGLILKLDDECEKVSIELEDTKVEYDKIKNKTENYEVPPVIEYVKKKAELDLLKKNLKVWARRKQIKDVALSASVREMRHTTGINTPRASWFVDPKISHKGRASVESNFQFMFEREFFTQHVPKRKKKIMKPVVL